MDGWHPEACRAGSRWPASWSVVGISTPSARPSAALDPTLVRGRRAARPPPPADAGRRRRWCTRWWTCCRTRAAARWPWARAVHAYDRDRGHHSVHELARLGRARPGAPGPARPTTSSTSAATSSPHQSPTRACCPAASSPRAWVESPAASGGRPRGHRPHRRVCRVPGDAARRGSRGGRRRSRRRGRRPPRPPAPDAGGGRRARGERGPGRRPPPPARSTAAPWWWPRTCSLRTAPPPPCSGWTGRRRPWSNAPCSPSARPRGAPRAASRPSTGAHAAHPLARAAARSVAAEPRLARVLSAAIGGPDEGAAACRPGALDGAGRPHARSSSPPTTRPATFP